MKRFLGSYLTVIQIETIKQSWPQVVHTSPLRVSRLFLYERLEIQTLRENVGLRPRVADQALGVQLLCNLHGFLCIHFQFP